MPKTVMTGTCSCCGESGVLDLGKCIYCWRREALCLRTSINIIVTCTEAVAKRPMGQKLEEFASDIATVLRDALE